MLAGLASWVIVGHSERRRDAGETDELIGRKLGRAVDAGLRPILCVGEQLDEREAGRRNATWSGGQLRGALGEPTRPRSIAAGLVIAYEPVWAIGTGRTASGADAAAMADAIRETLAELGLPGRRRSDPGALRRQRHVGRHRRVHGRARDRRGARRRRLAQARRDGRHRRPGRRDGRRPRIDGVTAERSNRPATAAHRARRPRRLRDRARPSRRRDRRGATCPSGAGSCATGRTPSCGRPRTRSACRRGRWATPRSATSTWVPAGRSSRTCRGSTPRSPMAASRPGRPSWTRCRRAARPGGRLHLVGLIGPGGVHANDRHLVALVELAAAQGVPSVRIHALLDGRDTPPRSAARLRRSTSRRGSAPPIPTPGSPRSAAGTARWIATGAGTASSAATTRSSTGWGSARESATAAIEAGYARGENDEFVAPTVIAGVDGTVRPRRSGRPLQLPRRPCPPAGACPGRPGVQRVRPGRARRHARRRPISSS